MRVYLHRITSRSPPAPRCSELTPRDPGRRILAPTGPGPLAGHRASGRHTGMDVTCTRCNTVYEFEEGLISTTGTTVKCTQCGHLFKVHRSLQPSSAPPPPDELETRELRWRVRRVNGSAHTLETLTELTRLIAAGQFAREDEISRTGQVWKKL